MPIASMWCPTIQSTPPIAQRVNPTMLQIRNAMPGCAIIIVQMTITEINARETLMKSSSFTTANCSQNMSVITGNLSK